MIEFLGLFFVLIGTLKYLTTEKMMIMVMSLEMCSIFVFVLIVFFSKVSGGLVVGLYSLFLVMVISEGVMVLVSLINIYRKGTGMTSSLYNLKF